MTGAEHYREAERLLVQADQDVSANMAFTTGEQKSDVLAAAQVHATLALTAATAYPAARDYYGDESRATQEWAGVIER